MASSSKSPPPVASLQDLTIIESFDPITDEPKYVTFYHVTPEDEVYFGQLFKNRRDITLEDCCSALKHVEDEEIYPIIPKDIPLKVAPGNLDKASVFIKRPGLVSYESLKGTEYIPREVLGEALIMDQVSRTPHPNIIRYFGCHVRRDRITAIVLQRLEQTLTQCAETPAFKQLNIAKFFEALTSAVDYLHSLGLAHNDINPYNVMIKNGMPVLIDFGSCRPFGERLQSLGTEGWYEEEFFTSEKKHDEYGLSKLRQWLDKPW